MERRILEKIDDLKQTRCHEKVAGAIRKYEGGIVKTIGDAVIAMNSSNHLDYFGRRVNRAARVQGKAWKGRSSFPRRFFRSRASTN